MGALEQVFLLRDRFAERAEKRGKCEFDGVATEQAKDSPRGIEIGFGFLGEDSDSA
jgi:hypothetical protein